MRYDRDPKYLHPYIHTRLQTILDSINAKLPVNHSAKMISAHRTPADQFELFKQGRVFRNGSWVKVGNVVTHLDGFVKLSRHNYLGGTAFDIGIFDGNTYLGNSKHYKHVREGVKQGLEWGGDWVTFKDQPHLEIPSSLFFKNNIQKDCGLIWQQYLKKAGTYTKSLDGIFGIESHKALKAATGEDTRNMKAWDKLFDRFGVISDYMVTN
jgi:peptidoglycan L-alanyl-D-glutamate endopeptidase CwlK